MGFLDHLEELRKRIIWSIVYIAVGFCVCYFWHEADLRLDSEADRHRSEDPQADHASWSTPIRSIPSICT